MRKYKNSRTGAVLITASIVSGGDWVEVVEKPAEKKKATTPKKTTKKKVEE